MIIFCFRSQRRLIEYLYTLLKSTYIYERFFDKQADYYSLFLSLLSLVFFLHGQYFLTLEVIADNVCSFIVFDLFIAIICLNCCFLFLVQKLSFHAVDRIGFLSN